MIELQSALSKNSSVTELVDSMMLDGQGVNQGVRFTLKDWFEFFNSLPDKVTLTIEK